MPKIPWKGVAAIVFSGLLVYVGITDLTLLFDQANRRHEVVRWWTEAEAWVLIVGMGLWWLTLVLFFREGWRWTAALLAVPGLLVSLWVLPKLAQIAYYQLLH